MTIANENNRVELTATGGQTVFAYDFKIEDDTEILVYLTPNGSDPDESSDLLTLTTDYAVSGVDNPAGGNITLTAGSYPTGATAGDVVTMIRKIAFDQPDAYAVGEDHAEKIEASMDRMTMRIQRLEEIVARAVRNHAPDPNDGFILPPAESEKVLAFNSAANALELIPRSSAVANIASLVSIADAGGYYVGTDVEAALQELQVGPNAFTLTMEGSATPGTGWAYGTNVNYAMEIGRFVIYLVNFGITTIGAGAAGNALIKGFPFDVDIISLNSMAPCSVLTGGVNLSVGYSWLNSSFSGFGTNTAMNLIESGDNVNSSIIDISQLTAPFQITSTIFGIKN